MTALHIIILIIYLYLVSLFLVKSTWVKASGLSNIELIILWLIKVLAGVTVVWLHIRYYPANDYAGLNRLGMIEHQSLIKHPAVFFSDWLYSPYANKYSGFFQSVGSYWNDLRNTILSKWLGVFNLINLGNIYVNTVLFTAFSTIGTIALFRVFYDLFPHKKRMAIIGCFLLPSTLLFSSGLHKDAIVFGLMSLFLYSLYFGMTDQWNPRKIIFILLTSIGLLLIRNYICILLLPISLLWYISLKKKLNAMILLCSFIFSVVFILIVADKFFPDRSPVNIVAQKQADYLNLPLTSSALPMQKMEPNIKSMLICLPMATEHAFLRPFLWEGGNWLIMSSAVELLIYQLLFFVFLFRYNRSGQLIFKNSIIFMIGLAFLLLLFVGYISPNAGALVRYRSLYLPLMITPLLCSIDWRRNSH